MTVSDRIQQYVRRLPERMQSGVLSLLEYLFSTSKRQEAHKDERDWSGMSLTLAIREMEHEDAPHYSEADLKETFE